jgi:hypothetical protein
VILGGDGEPHHIAGLAMGRGAVRDQRAVRSGTRAISVTVISVTPRDGKNGQAYAHVRREHFPATAQSDHLAGAARAPVAALQRGFAASPHAGGDPAAMDVGAQLHGGREAESPTMWLMSDIEALAFIATVALMVMLALVVA